LGLLFSVMLDTCRDLEELNRHISGKIEFVKEFGCGHMKLEKESKKK